LKTGIQHKQKAIETVLFVPRNAGKRTVFLFLSRYKFSRSYDLRVFYPRFQEVPDHLHHVFLTGEPGFFRRAFDCVR
jgi:hypothetical protein